VSAYVLVIDDSPTIRKIIEVCLHRAGYPVTSFPGGVEAIRWLTSAEADIPGLVFVDLCLPKMNGYDVIRRLRTNPAFAQTIFVMISCCDGVLDRLKGRLAGAKDYLVKPLKTAELVAVTQAALGPTSLTNEQARHTIIRQE
jgi:twitching motility two-component system response regulator PilG